MKNDEGIYIADLLRAYIGRSGMSVDQASNATGINPSSIYSHMNYEGAVPNGVDMARYMRVLPESFGNLYLRLADMTGAYHPTIGAGCKFRQTLHGQTLIAECLGFMAKATEDGQIDHVEERELPPVIFATTAYMNALASSFQGSAA